MKNYFKSIFQILKMKLYNWICKVDYWAFGNDPQVGGLFVCQIYWRRQNLNPVMTKLPMNIVFTVHVTFSQM